jgi:hypothetical protein
MSAIGGATSQQRRTSRFLALLVVVVIIGQACTSGGEGADETGAAVPATASQPAATVVTGEAAETSADGPSAGWTGPTPVPPGTCTVQVAASEPIAPALDGASAGDVVCVSESSRTGEAATITTAGVALVADGAVVLPHIAVLADDVRVEGFEITNSLLDSAETGIFIAGRNVTIIGNHIHDTRGEGIICDDDEGETCDGVIIAHNTLARNVGIQVETWGSDVTVEANDIRTPLWSEAGRDTDTLRVMGGSNQVVRGNYLEIPDINADTPDPHPDCLMMFDSDQPEYADWVVNVNVVIENNICVNDSDHNCFILSGRRQGRSRDFVIRNNVCDHAGANAFFVEDLDNVLLSNNLCTARVARNCIALVGTVGEVTSQNNVFTGDGVLHQVNTPEQTRLIEHDNYQGDVEFEDPTNANPWLRYRPVSGSALVDIGANDNLAANDILGDLRVQGAGPDAGPYESSP